MLRLRCAVVLAVLSAAAVVSVGASEARPGADDKDKKPKVDKDKKPKDDKDNDVKGTLWTYTATIVTAKGQERTESGTLRTYDYKVYRGGNQIGTITKSARDGMELHITEGQLQGKINLVQTRNDPLTFQGEWIQKDNDKGRVLLQIKNK